ncbi:MAG: efflux RND transporter periplasmic adaptor subunit [Bacteroidetes bacterium]|nr:MAG: efflux RND transporter periplasmic adaptor subunit [Bacteroidota bacterium]
MNYKAVFSLLFMASSGVLMVGLSGCKQDNKNIQQPPSFSVMTVTGTSVPVYLEMVGQAEGIPTVEIRARVEGYLENWSFQEGSIVRKGQVLFTIEKDQYINNVNFSQADLANKEAAWEYSKLNVERLRPLVATSAISQNDFDVAVTQEKQAKAAVESAKADLRQSNLNLSYTTIISPITGYIGAVDVRPGNLVGRGESTLLATVSAVDPIYINFQMNETDYLRIVRWIAENEQVIEKRGEAPIKVYLTLSDNKEYSLAGEVDFIGRTIDPATGAIAMRAVFSNPKGIIKPGTFARVKLILNEKEDAVVIPQSTIQQIQDKYFVFILDTANKVTRVPVILGQYIGNTVVVSKGLDPGARILLEGYQKIREGMPVTPVEVKDTLTVPAPGE